MSRRYWFYSLLLIGFAIACTEQADDVVSHASPPEITSHSVHTEEPDSLPENLQESPAFIREQPIGNVRLPEVNPLAIQENFTIAGSSTLHPLVQTLYDRFIEEGYQGEILLESITSNLGFKLFCNTGESDIVSSDRPIGEREIQDCSQSDRILIPFRIGTDAIVVTVNPKNDFLEDVSLEELAQIFIAENWSDVNPNWPKKTIERFIPSRESGTFRVFVNRILPGRDREILNAPNTTENEEEEILAQSVSLDRYSVSFLSYAYYQDYAETLKLVAINGMIPNHETVKSDRYPLTRSLYLYSDAKIMQEKLQVAEFINFFLTNVNEEISKVGYFPDSVEVLDEAEANWLKAMGK